MTKGGPKEPANDGAGGAPATADDNVVQTFQLEKSRLRGRAVRLGSALNTILEPHAYPESVARLVAETATLTLLLSSMLKYDGIFTLQTKGDGPVSMLVADVDSKGNMRSCAGFDEERLAALPEDAPQADLLGKGYVAFTVDPGGDKDRYQGIVELTGGGLAESVRHYFAQSEQIGAGIQMAVGKRQGGWRAGAIMLQTMPEEGGTAQAPPGEAAEEEDWRRAMALLGSCTDAELLDPFLHSNGLLYRLFHEEGVRVYAPRPVQMKCRCDEGRVRAMLAMMKKEDLDYMAKDGRIEAKCEFCSRTYAFGREEFGQAEA